MPAQAACGRTVEIGSGVTGKRVASAGHPSPSFTRQGENEKAPRRTRKRLAASGPRLFQMLTLAGEREGRAITRRHDQRLVGRLARIHDQRTAFSFGRLHRPTPRTDDKRRRSAYTT